MKPLARYEMKFHIEGADKESVLKCIRQAMICDPHGEDGVYRVTSLYYDSPERKAYWEKLDGVPIRKKIRLRYYGSEPASPFIELKHRYYEHVLKERLALPGSLGNELLDQQIALEDVTIPLDTEEARESLWRLQTTAAGDRSEGAVVITYMREAWVGRVDPRLRVTFDHLCQAHPPGSHRNSKDNSGLALLPPTQIVLEVKFDLRLPLWLRDGLAQCRLRPVRFSKYAEGLTQLADARREAVRSMRSKL